MRDLPRPVLSGVGVDGAYRACVFLFFGVASVTFERIVRAIYTS